VGDVAVISKLDGDDLVTSGRECFPKCLHGCQACSMWVSGRTDNFRWRQCIVLTVDVGGVVMRAEIAV
jgi:hypothetical protein